jgi:hypothetical protein
MRLFVMVAGLLSLVAQTQLPTAQNLSDFRYTREVMYPASSPGDAFPNACATLDGNVFAHANTGLTDLRVFDPSGKVQIPYVVTLSNTSPTSDPARIIHVALSGARQLDLVLEMPRRAYSQVDLSLSALDFVASAHVTGLRSLTDAHPVFLGDFTLFDLASQHLGSSTSIPIAESTFPFLRIRLMFEPASKNNPLLITPSTVAAAQVPPARQAQTLYTVIAHTFDLSERGQQTVASFQVPARVPIERVSFALDPGEQTNFSRSVAVSASTSQSGPVETLTGQISRVHLVLGGKEIEEQSLSIPAILGSNSQEPAHLEVSIENGPQPPLRIRSVLLEMRQRQLCFPAAGTNATLAYGSDEVEPATYEFARTFNASSPVRRAKLQKEDANPLFTAPSSAKSRFKRFPAFLGLSIVIALSLLAVIAYRALQRGHRDSLRR